MTDIPKWLRRRIQRRNAAKTHCKWGHEYTPENTLRGRRGRSCRECGRARSREYMRRRAESH